MSREILFRGKRTDKDEFAEGYFGVFKGVPQIYVPFTEKEEKENEGHIFSAIGGLWHKVVPETVGQYTNRDAANGKIFEGDILQSPKGEILVAAYAGTQFTLRQLNGRAKTWLHANSYRIIGNKFDNPELLEVRR
ncbi:MAG: hypothetical protein IJX94_01230 [Clostridia bacterium]|nr:hypothetical protein [Clostridia bacterium]